MTESLRMKFLKLGAVFGVITGSSYFLMYGGIENSIGISVVTFIIFNLSATIAMLRK